ncbi:MAG: Fic family protein [Dongiaceae bacterium]
MINTQNLSITSEILSLIAEIDEFKGAWRIMADLTPERLSTLRRVATIESIGSSTRIEGSQLSDREVEDLLFNLKRRAYASRDEQEVAGYAETIQTVIASFETIPLTENYIKQLHRDLLKYSEKDTRHRGEYKKNRNDVGAYDENGVLIGVVFQTSTPLQTPFFMQELVEWTEEHLISRTLHPLLVIGIFIVVFLEIHPFQDGNGRLSRILTTLLLLRAGYLYTPYSSMENIIEHNKEAYYLALRQTQSSIRADQPNWQPWLVFFLKTLQKQVHKLADKISREKSALVSLSESSLKISDLLQNHGLLTIGQIAEATRLNRNTLKSQLRKLVKEKHLKKYGQGRLTKYGINPTEEKI